MEDESRDYAIGVLVLTGLIVLVLLLMGFRPVSAGTVKVVTRFGGTTGRVLEPGLNFIVPFVEGTKTLSTKKVIYEVTSAEKQEGSDADYKDFPVDTNTKDGQQVDIYYTVRFSVDPTQAVWVINNIGGMDSLVEKVVKTESRIWARNVPREFDAEELYSGNVTEVQVAIEEKLRPVFEKNGVILDSVGIREIKFTDEYVDAIEQKQIQAVKVETEKNIAEQAKYQKEAKITQAEAQAREQELLRETLSSEVLQKMWIERWDGKLPVYMMGGEATNLIQLPTQ